MDPNGCQLLLGKKECDVYTPKCKQLGEFLVCNYFLILKFVLGLNCALPLNSKYLFGKLKNV